MKSRTSVLVLAGSLVLAGCREQPAPASAPVPIASVTTRPAAPPPPAAPARRDLSVDESRGGHTLSRHVGRSDEQLRERLRQEKQISAASTYTDRETAETIVTAALTESRDELERWTSRRGTRPNLVIEYDSPAPGPIGRSLRRGRRASEPSHHALVVLRWDERNARYYVLTSYPEGK